MRKLNQAITMALTAALVLACAGIASAAITKGPYLQNVTQDAITIAFETDTPGLGAVDFGATGDYGMEESADPVDSIDFVEGTRYVYKIRLFGLSRAHTYHYRIRHGADTSDDFAFVTAPHHLDSFNLVFFGDSRGGSIDSPNPAHEAVIDAIDATNPGIVFNTGDMVAHGADKADWDYFFQAEKMMMARAPLYPVYGNHEDDTDIATGLTGTRFWKFYFDTPNPSDPTWYSFDYGNIHFIIIDVNKWWNMLPGAQEYVWLVEDLTKDAANRRTNFTIALFHQPAFSWAEGRTADPTSRLIVEPMLRGAGVDLVVAGHDHFYARASLYGIPHVVTGGGGAPLYELYPNVEGRPNYVMHEKDYHYINVEATPMALSLEVVNVMTGALIDSFTLDADEAPEDIDGDDDDAGDDDGDDDDDDAANDDDAGDDDNDDAAGDDDASDDDVGAPADDDDDDDDDDGCGCGC
ncbi:metallophosphoesterase family protein [bacterium]|nr:metallophosphoesterase family protein [bacterium]